MTWANLQDEITDEFAQLSWRADDIQIARERQRSWQRARKAEEAKLNGVLRAQTNACQRRYYARRRSEPQWIAKKRERERLCYKRNAATRRAKKKARRVARRAVVDSRVRELAKLAALERRRAKACAYQYARYHTDPVFRARLEAWRAATRERRLQYQRDYGKRIRARGRVAP